MALVSGQEKKQRKKKKGKIRGPSLTACRIADSPLMPMWVLTNLGRSNESDHMGVLIVMVQSMYGVKMVKRLVKLINITVPN
jgi:hypothetical protein